jgi:hypothetical protein
MSKKYPSGPVPMHKTLATGDSLKEATSEKRVGGSKSDKSKGTAK